MRRTISIMALLFLAINVWGQIEEQRNRLEIGFSGGYNLNRIDLRPTVRQNMLGGFGGGINVRYTSEKYFSMICAAQLEINFAQRGWDEDFDDDTKNRYSRTLNYIEIPFFAHLSWGREDKGFQFFVNLGPQFGFFVGDSEMYYGEWKPEERPVSINKVYGKKVQNTFDYGIAGGLGVEWKTKAGNFFLEGRYYYGLADIFRNSKADPFARSANQTISARLGYSIVIFK